MKQVYRSKIDIWLLILILAAWGIPLTFIVCVGIGLTLISLLVTLFTRN